MNPKCPVCSAESFFFLNQSNYNLFRCSACELLFVDPMPTDSDLAKVYSPSSGYQANKIKKDYKNEINKKYIRIFKELKKYTTSGQKILDVGASDGEFLYYAKKEGFIPFGVEPNKTTADIANKNNLNVFYGYLSESNFPRNSFDVLHLGDVLEHSNLPEKLLFECNEFLKERGLLVISIPNMDSFWARSTYLLTKFNLPWSVITPPHHLLYFKKSNLDLFFEKKGFSLVHSWFERPPTLKYELGSTHLLGKWKRDKSTINFLAFFFGFGLYSILYLVDYLVTPLKSKDFGMVCIYKKNA